MNAQRLYLAHFALIASLTLACVEVGFSHPAEIGWNLASLRANEWERTSGEGALTLEEGRIQIIVPPNTEAVWTLTAEPIWVYRFSQARVRFLAEGLAPTDAPLFQFLTGSIGPVTPGADNIENPFARPGAATLSPVTEALTGGDIQHVSATVYPPIQTEQIDRIQITARAGAEGGRLELFDISFVDPDAAARPYLSLERLSPAPDSLPDVEWRFIDLPETENVLASLAHSEDELDESVVCEGVPFRLNGNRSAQISSLPLRSRMAVAIEQRCAEVYLLLSAYLVGTDQPFSFVQRNRVILPDRLIVVKEYADGAIEKSFPKNLRTRNYEVEAEALAAYVVPADPNRVLRSVAIEEYMHYGQIALAAVSVNPSPERRAYPSTVELPRSLHHCKPISSTRPASITLESNERLILENGLYRMVFDDRDGFRLASLQWAPTDTELLVQPTPIFAVIANGLLMPPDRWRLQASRTANREIELTLRSSEDEIGLEVALTLEADSSGAIRMRLTLTNAGQSPQRARLLFPALEGLRLSETAERDKYFFPRKPVAWGDAPVDLSGAHAGEFPPQFFSLYSPEKGFGLGVHTRDREMIPKQYRYRKETESSRMGVEYGFHEPIRLNAGDSFETALTVLQLHSGDWRAPYHDYRNWLTQWSSNDAPSREVLRRVFLCRRDYPIGGTDYLFDLERDAYTFDRLIRESRETFGGVDMIDISSWAYSERYGRVGAYEEFELGGAESLRQGVTLSQREGVPVGLYFEGYLLDPRTPIAEQAADWRIFEEDGTPMTWVGNEEMYMNPLASGWRNFMAGTVRRVAERTGVDAIYLDQYGFANVAKISHRDANGFPAGTHPAVGEILMLRQVREALDELERPVALYVEEVPNDIAAQYVDAAFSYNMLGERPYSAPTKLNLLRFAMPGLKVIELFHAGIDPRAASPEHAKLCFFHGSAMWLKGRGLSWYSRDFREFTQRAHAVFQEHADAFTSNDVEPLIPTERRGLYANRFSAPGKTLYTLYNATPHTITGKFLAVEGERDNVHELIGLDDFSTAHTPGGVEVFGRIHPGEVGCVLVVDEGGN